MKEINESDIDKLAKMFGGVTELEKLGIALVTEALKAEEKYKMRRAFLEDTSERSLVGPGSLPMILEDLGNEAIRMISNAKR